MNTISGIYVIRNINNGKVYVGSSKDIKSRWNEHHRILKNGRHHSPKLQNSWNKHGDQAFRFSFIEECAEADLPQREQFWINDFKAVGSGYNVCSEVGTTRGIRFKRPPFTLEHRENIRISKLGERNPNFGKSCSTETKDRIRNAQKGKSRRKATQEEIEARRAGIKNRWKTKGFPAHVLEIFQAKRPNVRGTIWIRKDSCNSKQIRPECFPDFERDGWKKGRGKKSTCPSSDVGCP